MSILTIIFGLNTCIWGVVFLSILATGEPLDLFGSSLAALLLTGTYFVKMVKEAEREIER